MELGGTPDPGKAGRRAYAPGDEVSSDWKYRLGLTIGPARRERERVPVRCTSSQREMLVFPRT